MARVESPLAPHSVAPVIHEPAPQGTGKWMALAAALLGWMFDGAEMGVFSLVGGKAMEALMPGVQKGERDLWFNIIMASFLVGAATGGVLFGWLGDRIGRVRAMTLSVLTYALFTGLCGLAQVPWQVTGLRFLSALGMGGEWALGVALVMESWEPEDLPKQQVRWEYAEVTIPLNLVHWPPTPERGQQVRDQEESGLDPVDPVPAVEHQPGQQADRDHRGENRITEPGRAAPAKSPRLIGLTCTSSPVSGAWTIMPPPTYIPTWEIGV